MNSIFHNTRTPLLALFPSALPSVGVHVCLVSLYATALGSTLMGYTAGVSIHWPLWSIIGILLHDRKVFGFHENSLLSYLCPIYNLPQSLQSLMHIVLIHFNIGQQLVERY